MVVTISSMNGMCRALRSLEQNLYRPVGSNAGYVDTVLDLYFINNKKWGDRFSERYESILCGDIPSLGAQHEVNEGLRASSCLIVGIEV